MVVHSFLSLERQLLSVDKLCSPRKCPVMFCHVSSSRGGNTSDSSVYIERVQEQKEKMQVELQTLWTEQYDQLRKKKEQCATEVSKIQVHV